MTEPQRDVRGRWLPGTPSPNPDGRPPRATEERVRERFSEQLTDQIIDALIRQALYGALDKTNPHRREDREFVARYAFPRPTERISVSGADALGEIDDATARRLVQDAADYLQEGPDSVSSPA